MKQWVVDNDGVLGIVATSGHQPPNVLCEARPEWKANQLSIDKETGVIFMDPVKIKQSYVEKQNLELQIRNKQFVDSISAMAPKLFYFIIVFAIGYFVAKAII